MANSELYNKEFKVPSNILKQIQVALIANPTGDGTKRAKNILRGGVITYHNMKRLKNFFTYFDHNNDNKGQYDLAGGNSMKSFIDSKLNSERDAVKRGDEIKDTYKINSNLGIKANQTLRLNE